MATVSFLASRLAPSGQFWLALAGGVSLARAGATHGLRSGYGASGAAMLETVALIGPVRVNGPLTQALNAPLIGHLHRRGRSLGVQFAACLGIRLVHYVALNVLLVWLIVGGVDAYVDSYDRIADLSGFLPRGGTAALLLTVALSLALAAFYSAVQVVVYRRALTQWPAPAAAAGGDVRPTAERPPRPTRRAVVIGLAAAALWAVSLSVLRWPTLGAVAIVLGVLCLALPREAQRDLRLGAVLGLTLAVAAIVPALLGVLPLEAAAQRAVRALLLVLVAAWARAAAGADGVRALGGALLWSVRAFPAAREAASVTALLRSDGRLRAAADDAIERFRDVPMRPTPLVDALTGWAAEEARAGERAQAEPVRTGR